MIYEVLLGSSTHQLVAGRRFPLHFQLILFLTEVFPCFFLSSKANARVKFAKTGHGPHSSKLGVIYIGLLLFVLFYVLFVFKCVLYHCHRVLTQLQLTNVSYHIIDCHPVFRCCID